MSPRRPPGTPATATPVGSPAPDGGSPEGQSVKVLPTVIVDGLAAHSHGIPPEAPPGSTVDAARAQRGRTLAINADGTWSPLASTGDTDYAWTDSHKDLQPDQFPDANPDGLAASGRTQYVADAGANLISKVDNHGNVSTLAYLQVPDGSITDVADPAHTATNPSPKPTSPDLSTQGDPYATHLNQRRWWPPLGRSHGHQRAVFMTATGQFLLAIDTKLRV